MMIRFLFTLALVATVALGAKKCKPQCVCVRAPCPCASKPRCDPGYKCVNEICIPIYKPTCPVCKLGFVCKGGKCVPGPPCALILCPPGTICKNGKCIPSCVAVHCPFGTKCKSGKCIPISKKCKPNFMWLGNSCVPFLCFPGCKAIFCRPCVKGYKCNSKGRCVWADKWKA